MLDMRKGAAFSKHMAVVSKAVTVIMYRLEVNDLPVPVTPLDDRSEFGATQLQDCL